MTLFEILLLAGAGFAAGLLNAVAGCVTFLSLPALVYVGIPPVSANATATLTALPGYISSAWGSDTKYSAKVCYRFGLLPASA
ncbi:TSUP family transporter [Leisingera caerulea]|uniref:TSUP family transporter n=1 Tax=Leisingera caerulea TaxID=506591 RepID=UPI0021A65243|nr:TSUP family transporter [Leisingera caerulea]